MIGMRRHDWYVLRAFWGTFLGVVLFLSVLIVVLDLSERVAKLTRFWAGIEAAGRSPANVLLEFYGTLLPFMWLKMMPMCVPAGAAFCLARLIRHNELVPLLTGGVSMRRIVWPLVLSGIVIVMGMFVLQEALLPQLSRRNMETWRLLNRSEPDRISRVPHFHDGGGGRLSMEAYRPIARQMDAVMITFRDTSGALREHHVYPQLAWNEERKAWIAERGGTRVPATWEAPGERQFPIPAGSAAPLVASATLIEIALTAKKAPGLSLTQVAELAAANPDSIHFVVLQHEMVTVLLSTLVLLLLTLPFSFRVARRTKSGVAGMAGALVVVALFFGAHFFMASLARAGDWNPVVIAWLPTVLFGGLGLSLYIGLDW